MEVNSRNERARQFIPFDALKGLKEAYRLKEIEVEERKDLSEEAKDELNEKLLNIQIGDNILIKYYRHNRYILKQGVVKYINNQFRKIVFEDNEEIKINDIILLEEK